ncbi:recombination-associated protein RdgC [Agaribacterium haliotis]|uniref:recombination-associated protein RdgC n=1 Tax=Agaribacterium haliotis TaxID=2013869 RepID=UPI000BB544A6|nr:recombination-associated protein RdgC [Agaribacterium haliotis]
MWFKNLRLFRLSEQPELDQLDLQLEQKSFEPCGKLDLQRYGWSSPLGRNGKMLSHSNGGATMICAKRQEKILPGAAINEALENKIFQIKEDEGRPVGRKEKQGLKDELIFSMLPQALSKSSMEYAYLKPADGLIYVNASSSKKAEDLLTLLRESLGSLKAVPVGTHHPIAPTLSQWLREGQAVSPFALGDQVELRASKDERVIRMRNQDLSADEVQQHLDTGMHVRRLALNWNEKIDFVLDDECGIKSLKFSDLLMEQAADQQGDDAAAVFDADFALMHGELSQFVSDLLAAFGGESELY